ncbi:MAG: chemotaxis response regulator protein-glutamate methylesterase, partial [bacterium]|nr:chemotaxis response regulator protein-glutamate methylesterase [bacterium]
MITRPIKVLVVDDSLLSRKLLVGFLSEDPDIEVVATASNGKDALEAVGKHNPDVVTMDVRMPEMDGITALKRIMSEAPRPVVMLSAFTERDTELTLQSLDLGAVDFITKPHPVFSRTLSDIRDEILLKVKTASRNRVRRRVAGRAPLPAAPVFRKRSRTGSRIPLGKCRDVVAIGISTGGPQCLQRLLPAVPADFPAAIVIVQHMPAGFTRVLAERLNGMSAIEVKEAESGDVIRRGRALLARGDHHLVIQEEELAYTTVVNRDPPVSRFRPSIDVMMESAARLFGERAIGVIMTGMCDDGVRGVRAIRGAGGRVIAQDEATSVVFGMNRLAIESGCVDRVVPLQEIVPALLEC